MGKEEKSTARSDQGPEKKGNILYMDPSKLIADNPAADIVNKESYKRLEGHFAPDQFDPPQVVRVSTYSSQGAEVIKYFVVDGMTRTKYAANHKGQKVPGNAAFTFDAIPVRDVTASESQNPIIVPLEERVEGQNAITMLQYLRAVIPPTVEHSEIAADRIAAHLINGWENMVGRDLAQKFSALAALSFLENQRVPIATEDQLRNFLRKQEELMAGETPEDRAAITQALVETASIIRQTKLFKQEIARSAYALVSEEASVIGGEKESYKQVYGLLHTPEVERKLVDAATSIGERENLRSKLGTSVANALRTLAKGPNGQQAVNTLISALKDSSISFGQLGTIFTSVAPVEAYDQIRKDNNVALLEKSYLATYSVPNLTPTEEVFIRQLGNKTFLADRDIASLCRGVNQAHVTFLELDTLRDTFTQERQELIHQGVLEKHLDEAIIRFDQAQASLLGATSLQLLTRGTQQVRELLVAENRQIEQQVQRKKVADLVDAVYDSELQTGKLSSQGRSAIYTYILREGSSTDLTQTKKILEQLHSLPADWQSKVLSGDIRLHFALQRYREEQQRLAKQQIKPIEPAQPQIPTTPTAPRRDVPPLTQQPFRPAVPTPTVESKVPVTPTKPENNARRVEQANRQVADIVNAALSALQTVDLDATEVSPQTKQAVDSLLRILGQRFYNTANIPGLIEEFPKLNDRVIALLQEKARRDQDDTNRGTQTGR